MIILKNDVTGETVKCQTGFSWTCLILTFIVPLWRRDWRWGLGAIAVSMLSIPTGLPIGLGVNALLAFMYNDFFVIGKCLRGFRPIDDAGRLELERLVKKSKAGSLNEMLENYRRCDIWPR